MMVAPTMADNAEEFDSLCEGVIQKFERLSPSVGLDEIEPWLTDIPPEKLDALVCELARISLEKTFAKLPDGSASPFLVHFPKTFSSERWRSELAFEHYRLARQNGHELSTQRVAELYRLSKWNWGELPLLVMDASEELGLKSNANFPKPGETFCGYPVVAKLGRGAIAQVFLAKQPDLAERLVVLKVTDRLTTEADKLAKLQHTNIVPVYSIHQSGKLYCICMPFLGSLTIADMFSHGHREIGSHTNPEQFVSTVVSDRLSTITFADGIEREKGITTAGFNSLSNSHVSNQKEHGDNAFSLLGIDELSRSLAKFVRVQNEIELAVHLISGVVDGMAYSHAHGIAHCDLKPENVLIANDGRPVILDFNLANRSLDTTPKLVGGTVPYMSPQQLLAIEPGTPGRPSDDVFAIGVMFYQLLTGKLPFPPGKHDTRDWKRIAQEREVSPKRPSRIVAGIAPSLESIVLKCIAPDETNRYASAQELQVDLTRYREIKVLKFAADRSVVERLQRFVRRNPTLVSSSFLTGLAALTLMLLISSSFWYADRVANLNASILTQQLDSQLPEVLAKLHSPSPDEQLLQDGIENAKKILGQWNVAEEGRSDGASLLKRLSPGRSSKAKSDLGYMMYAVASAEANLAAFDAERQGQHVLAASRWNAKAGMFDPGLASALRLQNSHLERFRGLGNKPNRDEEHADIEHVDTAQAEEESSLGRMLAAREQLDVPTWRKLADEIVKEHPTDPTAWFNLGAAHFSLGQFEKSSRCFDVAVKLQPLATQSLFWRGVCRLQLGELDNAYDDFSRCLEANPRWVAARFNRALSLQRRKEFSSAVTDLEVLDQQGSASTRAWVLRSQLAMSLGMMDEAKNHRKTALEVTPKDADDWTSLGLLQIGQNPEKALESFQHAIKLDPYHFAALQNSANVLSEQLNRLDDAITVFDTLAERRSNQSSIFATRGILCARGGRDEAAKADASRAIQLSPGPIEQLQIAGIFSLLSSPKTAAVTDDAASAAAKQKVEALKWLARALTADPKLGPIAEHDNDLLSIQKEPKFRELIANAKGLLESSR